MSTTLRITVDELKKRMESRRRLHDHRCSEARSLDGIAHHDSGIHSRVARSTGPQPQGDSEGAGRLSHTALDPTTIRASVWRKSSAHSATKMHGHCKVDFKLGKMQGCPSNQTARQLESSNRMAVP